MQFNLGKIMLEVAECEQALAALPEDVRKQILGFKTQNSERISKALKAEEEQRKAEEAYRRKRKEEEEQEKNKLLCKGAWGEKIPLHRRFALCKRMGKRFTGWCGQENDTAKWVDEVKYCAIDLVRGYMSPYWGYYLTSASHKAQPFYDDRIRPILEADSEEKLVRKIRVDWNFFKIKTEDDNFSVLDYDIVNGQIIEKGESPVKTLQEHQEALKKEFIHE